MKYLLGIAGLLGLLLIGHAVAVDSLYEVQPQPLATNVAPLGINLGLWTTWGAEQLPSSVLKNPGFEGIIDRTLICVSQSDSSWFVDDTNWNARPAGFWNGASFEVLSGNEAGTSGTILDNQLQNGLAWFRTDADLSGLRPGDIVTVTRVRNTDLPTQWWFENSSRNRILADNTNKRPGSGGIRSLVLAPDSDEPIAAISYLDAIGDRAGKLLPMHGKWRVRFWARSTGNAALNVTMTREGSPAFLDQTVQPTSNWQAFEFTFQPNDSGPEGILALRLKVIGPGSRVWLDDTDLTQVSAGDSLFRREVVESLRRLKPGYLRDWQGQLGDTWTNRIASLDARRPSRYRAGGDEQTDYFYSVPEFLELCAEIGARPWLVLPTTMTAKEWRAAGKSISELRIKYGFEEMTVEFGDENWNELFRPAGIMSPVTLANVMNRAEADFRVGSGGDRHIQMIVGGNAQNPSFLKQFSVRANRDILQAVAPYYLSAYPAQAPRSEMVRRLFLDGRPAREEYAAQTTPGIAQLSLYELNASTLGGDAPASDVNALLARPEAGSAMVWRAMNWLEAGALRQCMWTLTGFDVARPNGSLVRLFGLARDVAAPGDFRPTGKAISLVNQIIAGDLHRVVGPDDGSNAKVWAFLNEGRWSLVLASASARPTDITVEFPAGSQKLPANLETLDGTAALFKLGQRLTVHLPPYGLAIAH